MELKGRRRCWKHTIPPSHRIHSMELKGLISTLPSKQRHLCWIHSMELKVIATISLTRIESELHESIQWNWKVLLWWAVWRVGFVRIRIHSMELKGINEYWFLNDNRLESIQWNWKGIIEEKLVNVLAHVWESIQWNWKIPRFAFWISRYVVWIHSMELKGHDCQPCLSPRHSARIHSMELKGHTCYKLLSQSSHPHESIQWNWKQPEPSPR